MKNPEENGSGEIFDPAIEMDYWLRHNPVDFIHSIAHEIREEAFQAKTYMKAIEDDPDIASRAVKSIWGPKTIGENNVAIRKHLERIRQLTMIASEYALAQRTDDTGPKT